jgi:hypothetical protein
MLELLCGSPLNKTERERGFTANFNWQEKTRKFTHTISQNLKLKQEWNNMYKVKGVNYRWAGSTSINCDGRIETDVATLWWRKHSCCQIHDTTKRRRPRKFHTWAISTQRPYRTILERCFSICKWSFLPHLYVSAYQPYQLVFWILHLKRDGRKQDFGFK